MARFQEIITDDFLRPIPNVAVDVLTAAGTLADLLDDEGDPLPNPLKTDEYGQLIFNAPDAVYTLQYRFGGALRRIDNRIVGDPPEFRGSTGLASNTFDDLAEFRAAPTTQFKSATLVQLGTLNGPFEFETENAPYTELLPNVIKADDTPLSDGAWVRQSDASVTFQNPLGGNAGPAILRLLRDRNGETVKVTDYCNNAGGSDHENYQELINLTPAQIDYPQGFEVLLDGQIMLGSNQRHNFDRGSGITADVNDYALFGLGLTSGNLGTVNAPITRGQWDIQFTKTDAEPLSSGDMIQIVDVTNPSALVPEPQIIQIVSPTLITVQDMINVDMPTPENIRIYKVYAPLRNVSFDGYARISNVNGGGEAGGIRFNLARDIRLRKTLFEEVRHIGASIENTIGFSSLETTFRDVVRSGLGFRSAKRINIHDFVASDLKSDEALTFFDNVLGINVSNVNIHQYLFGQDPDGGTAGNNILFDKLCAHINMVNILCSGSATYNVFFNDRTINATLSNFNLSRANLGSIRTANNCENIKIGNGAVSDVINAAHPASGFGEANSQPCVGVMFDPSSSGCGLIGIVTGERIETQRVLLDRQDPADRPIARTGRMGVGVESPVHTLSAGGTIGAQSPGTVPGVSGNTVTLMADDDRVAIQGGAAGGATAKPLFLNPDGGTLVHTAPAFASNGDAAAAGLGAGEWFRNTSNQNAVTQVV